MRFHLYPLSRAFSIRCVFDENAQRFSVDRRPKRIEMYAFSNENALVWAGPNFRLLCPDVRGHPCTLFFAAHTQLCR